MNLRADQIYARDNVSSLANRYGRALAVGLSVDDVHDWPELLQSITEADILDAAKTYLDRKSAVTGFARSGEEVTQ